MYVSILPQSHASIAGRRIYKHFAYLWAWLSQLMPALPPKPSCKNSNVLRVDSTSRMGSGVSRLTNGAHSDSNDESKRNLEDKASLTSTAGLQLLLEQGYLRENLRDFISTQWTPSLSDEDFQKYVQISPRTLAMNCVDFWTDIQDYVTIKPSVFQSFRAHHIYERYVVHGASHLVSIIDDIASKKTVEANFIPIHDHCFSFHFSLLH